MMEGTVSNGMCRCCASEGTFKDVKTTYHWMGEEEIYADMLRDCFDINITISEHGEDGGICEVCITQLRNAVNFKKQVLQTEEQFKTLFRPNIVKMELPLPDLSDDNVSGDDGGFSAPEYEVPIKTEVDELKPKKRAAASKASTSRAKKAKADNGETSSKQLRSRNKECRDSSPKLCDEEPRLTLDRKINFSSFITIRPVGKRALRWVTDQQKKIAQEKRLTELDWQFDNIKTILKCSNASPMRCRVGKRFACSYCLDQFQNLSELRSHSVQIHLHDKPIFFHSRSLSNHIVYLDITDLICTLCKQAIKDLEDLMDHLKSVHEELIHKQIKNQIVPFKRDGENIMCGVCSCDIGEFSDFQDHMCEHYRNYICGFCDSAFVTRSKMLEHKKLVHFV